MHAIPFEEADVKPFTDWIDKKDCETNKEGQKHDVMLRIFC
jgi:hypothetical protein